ncbi:hypothetical protein SK3146_06898 [Paenibacillus konkukensis]|uniref:Cache domain-containing protein n=1 Tax=Paenibacillus konkukensis TaxID=2020716 RepID=A0ABY4S1P8_9BACL|nr:cache domain-containing protein [Paenibacillus konkukensis]UQZ87596.1 hypothetical protein SK3146_06898 [Paenibacillus konkukensis]
MFYSLKNRLIAFFVILLVVSFGTMFYLLFQESRSMIRSYIESSALEKMDEYGSFVHMALSQMYDLSSVVFNSETTKKWDSALSDPSLPEGEKMLANIAMSLFLTQTTNNYSIASSVSIYRKDGTRVGDGNEVSANIEFQDEGWYRKFVNEGDHWESAHSDPVEALRSRPYQVLSLMLPIGTFEPTLAKSVLKVNVSSDYFLEPLNRIHLGENGTIFLVDQDGRPILSQEAEYDANPNLAPNVALARSAAESQGVLYVQNARGTTDILVYKKLQMNNWMLVGLVPEKDLFLKLFKLRDSSLLVSALLLLFAIIGASWISYGITKPLSRLASAMRHVWASFVNGSYALGVSTSASGKVTGPWVHEAQPLYQDDGGHGMLFRTFDGRLMLTIHTPNRTPDERPIFLEVEDAGGKLRVKGEYCGLEA